MTGFRCILLALLFALPSVAARAGQPADVDACVREALAGNPDLAAMRARSAAAQASVREAQSAYYPQVGVAAGYARTDNPPQAFMMALNQRELDMADPAFDPNQPEDTENTRLSVQARYALYDGGRRGLGRAAAEAGAEAARAQEAAARNDLVHEVRRAWYGVRQAGALLRLAEDTLASMEENLRVARERESAGRALSTDAMNLDVARAEAEEQVIRARNRLELAGAALNTAIGREYAAVADVMAVEIPGDPAVPAFDPAEVARRPEWAAAVAAARARESQWRLARRGYAPRVHAFGSLDWDSAADTDFEQSYLAGVSAEWDVFTGFRRGAETAAAEQALRAARAEADAVRNRLALDYRAAALGAGESAQRLDVARRSRQSAEEALRITRLRYAEGSADVTELLTAQNGLTATRAREESARYDLWTALSNVERAGGRLAQAGGNPGGDR